MDSRRDGPGLLFNGLQLGFIIGWFLGFMGLDCGHHRDYPRQVRDVGAEEVCYQLVSQNKLAGPVPCVPDAK